MRRRKDNPDCEGAGQTKGNGAPGRALREKSREEDGETPEGEQAPPSKPQLWKGKERGEFFTKKYSKKKK